MAHSSHYFGRSQVLPRTERFDKAGRLCNYCNLYAAIQSTKTNSNPSMATIRAELNNTEASNILSVNIVSFRHSVDCNYEEKKNILSPAFS